MVTLPHIRLYRLGTAAALIVAPSLFLVDNLIHPKEVARHNVRVLCLAPGLLEDGVGRNLPEHKRTDYLRHCALGRVGTFSEVAEFAAFLVSEQNSYQTGATVVIDGGV